jgi:hypothetical protein
LLAVVTESVTIGLRFFTATAGGVQLALAQADGDELVLHVAGSRSGLKVSSCETAALCGALVYVEPRQASQPAAAMVGRLAASGLNVVPVPDGWLLTASALDGTELRTAVDARPACLYATEDMTITANEWVRSLAPEGD